MSRNWYVGSRETVGGNQSPGSYTAHDTQRDNVIQLASRLPPGTVWPNSRSQEVEPFIHPFELGSGFLFAAVVLLPIAVVSGVVIGYLAFIA
jgi:hypothetical protein